MKTNWTLLLTSGLIFAGLLLARTSVEFLQGLGASFVVSAVVFQLAALPKLIRAHRERQLSEN